MAMANIDLFDEYTAKIFAALYDAFPRKIVLDARILCGHEGTDDFGQVVNPEGRPSAQFEVAMATIDWLRETGYIRADDSKAFGATGAVLTASGLMVLKATPESLRPTAESIGEKLIRNVREGSLGAARETAKAAISAGVGLAMGAIGKS